MFSNKRRVCLVSLYVCSSYSEPVCSSDIIAWKSPENEIKNIGYSTKQWSPTYSIEFFMCDIMSLLANEIKLDICEVARQIINSAKW